MGLGRASSSYSCHFGVFGSWWVPSCGSVWCDLVWWSYSGNCGVTVIGGKLCTGRVAAGDWVAMKGADA